MTESSLEVIDAIIQGETTPRNNSIGRTSQLSRIETILTWPKPVDYQGMLQICSVPRLLTREYLGRPVSRLRKDGICEMWQWEGQRVVTLSYWFNVHDLVVCYWKAGCHFYTAK